MCYHAKYHFNWTNKESTIPNVSTFHKTMIIGSSDMLDGTMSMFTATYNVEYVVVWKSKGIAWGLMNNYRVFPHTLRDKHGIGDLCHGNPLDNLALASVVTHTIIFIRQLAPVSGFCSHIVKC